MRQQELSKSDIKGLTIIAMVIACVTLIVYCSRHSKLDTDETSPFDSAEAITPFWDSIVHPISYKKNSHIYPHKRQHSQRKMLPFDPNSVDSATLTQLGLPPWIARRIIRYRNAGGTFRTPEDMQKIYGLSPKDYQAIRPYIHILSKRQQKDTLTYASPNTHKFTGEIHLDLNEVDSATLVRIPHIGAYRAHQIIHYRKRLGGYHDTRQLLEIKGISEDDLNFFYVDNNYKVLPIFINRMEFKELLLHPYLNFNQVKAIINYKRKFGEIQNIQQLSNDTSFTVSDLERLSPYISME